MLNITGHASATSDANSNSHLSITNAHTVKDSCTTSDSQSPSSGGACATQQEFASSTSSESSLHGRQRRSSRQDSPAQTLPQHGQQKQRQQCHSTSAGMKRSVKAVCRRTTPDAAEHSPTQEPLGNVVGTPLCSRQPNANQGSNAVRGNAAQLPDRTGQKTARQAVCKGLITQRGARQQRELLNHPSNKHDCVASGVSVQAAVLSVTPTRCLHSKPKTDVTCPAVVDLL